MVKLADEPPSDVDDLLDARVDGLLDARRIAWVTCLVIIIGLLALAVVCRWRFPQGIVWALACLATGFFAGFLFGIPRVLQREHHSAELSSDTYRQKVNTNLEDISDWVTKIIVGLGIYQLDKVPFWLDNLAMLFARSVQCDQETTGVFGGAIVFFLVCGFLLGYLLTRLYLQGALGRADRLAVPDERAAQKQRARRPAKNKTHAKLSKLTQDSSEPGQSPPSQPDLEGNSHQPKDVTG